MLKGVGGGSKFPCDIFKRGEPLFFVGIRYEIRG